MSPRAGRTIVMVALAVCCWSSGVGAADVTHPYPGITYIKRTDTMPFFRCPGCPPPPASRMARMNIVLVDLTAPEVRFKMMPEGKNLPLPNFPTPGWPLPPPPFETVRQTTLGYLESSHAQVAIDTHFFAPFPVPSGSTQGAYAYLIGLAASRGNVYSAFESPFQNYAIVTDSPGINIDRENRASIVHRDPAVADGKHVLEDVTLWNALAGSAQIITNGVKTIPDYKDATHPDELLTPNGTYTRGGRHWYYLSNARTAIGLTEDNKTLVLFTAKALTVRLDGSAPVVDGLPAAGCTLWPPNHKMRQVAVVSAADALSGVAPGSLQVTATSNEPSDPNDPDVLVTPDGSGGFVIELRAERRGSGPGRVYTMTATAKDLAANVRTVTATCTVPHDQGKR